MLTLLVLPGGLSAGTANHDFKQRADNSAFKDYEKAPPRRKVPVEKPASPAGALTPA
jgi:hypothetical protein